MPRSRQSLDAQLAQLEDAQLVRRAAEEELAYLFKHALTQETAYESLLYKRRRELHLQVAQVIEQLYPKQLDEYAARLAQHYAEAGDDAKTLEYATRAGDIAARVYANDEAIALYTRALDAAQRGGATTAQFIHLYTLRGRVLEVSGKFAQALDGYEEMAALARTRGDRPLELASLMLRATARSTPVTTFDPELAQQLSNQALALARELNDRAAQARLLWNLVILSNHTSQAQRAIEYGEQALAIARELNESGYDLREQTAYILHDLSTPYLFGRNPARGRALNAEARELWRELDNKPMLADNLGMVAMFSLISGDFERALEYTKEGAALARSIGNWFGVFFNLSFQSLAHMELGEFDAAWHIGKELMRIAATSGAITWALAFANLAWLLAMVGAFGPAREIEQRTRRALARPMPGHFRVRTYATLARYDLLRGDLAAAAKDLAASWLEVDPSTQFYAVVQRALAEAELALAQGNPDRAIALVEDYLRGAQQFEFRWALPELFLVHGLARARQAKIQAAFESWRAARTHAESTTMRRVLWQVLAALSDLELQRGNASEANALRAQARAVIEYIADHTPAEYRDSFLNLPSVRAVLDPNPPSV